MMRHSSQRVAGGSRVLEDEESSVQEVVVEQLEGLTPTSLVSHSDIAKFGVDAGFLAGVPRRHSGRTNCAPSLLLVRMAQSTRSHQEWTPTAVSPALSQPAIWLPARHSVFFESGDVWRKEIDQQRHRMLLLVPLVYCACQGKATPHRSSMPICQGRKDDRVPFGSRLFNTSDS
ncbi:hypothetical protein BR93DRAFT_327825 [Coniochaeta sp. PMI_546]|nr:hypothetical protein BR93DRAFT_327825 [Coniochaeta sp. PMI_546]